MERYNVKEVGVCRNNKHETFWTIGDKEDELPLVILVSRGSADRLCEYFESQDQNSSLVTELEEHSSLIELSYVEDDFVDTIPVLEVTEDITALINLMNDYNLTWACVYNIIKEAIEESVEE